MSQPTHRPHVDPLGPGDLRPTAEQIMQQQDAAPRIKGKTVLITGASSGIGIETARVFAKAGAILYLPVRDKAKGQIVVDEIRSSLGRDGDTAKVELLHVDLEDLDSVRSCAADFLRQSSVLHILINNAGVMACPQGKTKQGFETQFGSNHLAHFLLFELLKPTLLSSSTPQFNSRVVCVSSLAHRIAPVLLDDLNLSKGYDKWKAYGNSKTANIWMANEIDRRYHTRGLHAYSLHPGGIQTGLMRHLTAGFTPEDAAAFRLGEEDAKNFQFKSIPQGAATTVYAAVAKEYEGKGGVYFEDCAPAERADDSKSLMSPGYAAWCYDSEGAEQLWAKSLQLLGLHDDQ